MSATDRCQYFIHFFFITNSLIESRALVPGKFSGWNDICKNGYKPFRLFPYLQTLDQLERTCQATLAFFAPASETKKNRLMTSSVNAVKRFFFVRNATTK